MRESGNYVCRIFGATSCRQVQRRFEFVCCRLRAKRILCFSLSCPPACSHRPVMLLFVIFPPAIHETNDNFFFFFIRFLFVCEKLRLPMFFFCAFCLSLSRSRCRLYGERDSRKRDVRELSEVRVTQSCKSVYNY